MIAAKRLFLSHSSIDSRIAKELKTQIEIEIPHCEVFLAPYSIPSGKSWFESLMAALDESSVFVLLLTPNSAKSEWVMFEYGYFWAKQGGQKIHILRHPSASTPSPLSEIQAKSITEVMDIEHVIESVCNDLGQKYSHKADLSTIVSLVKNTNFESSEQKAKKQELIRKMGSRQPTTSIPATEELRHTEWLFDGSLKDQTFSGANLETVNLKDAVLEKSSFRNANLKDAYLLECKLAGSDFDEAVLENAELSYAILDESIFNHANLKGATLLEASLISAKFTRANLENANLSGANLEGVDFRSARLNGANLREANLKNAIFDKDTTRNFDEKTKLPNGNYWSGDTNMEMFTNPKNIYFWRSSDIESPAYY